MNALEQAATAALSSGERVASFAVGGEKYWVKQVQERGVLLRLQKGPASRLMDNEIKALKGFSKQNIHVPELVLQTGNFFVTKDIGPSFEATIRTTTTRAESLIQAALAVAELHNNGFAHGGLHMRNMCDDSENIRFLDLEKATMRAGIKDQAYDIVVFVWSMLSIDPTATQDLEKALAMYKMIVKPDVWMAVNSWAKSHGWMRWAAKPLAWHEAKYRAHKPYQRYKAVPPALDFLST